jgi:hypothetical protein
MLNTNIPCFSFIFFLCCCLNCGEVANCETYQRTSFRGATSTSTSSAALRDHFLLKMDDAKRNPMFEENVFADAADEDDTPRRRAHTSPLFSMSMSRKIATPFNTQTQVTTQAATFHEGYQAHQAEQLAEQQQFEHNDAYAQLQLRIQHEQQNMAAQPSTSVTHRKQTQAQAVASERRLSSSFDDLMLMPTASGTLQRKQKAKGEASTLSRSTLSLKQSGQSIRNFLGSVKRKLTMESTPKHVCKPVSEGMSRCKCGKSW